MHTNAMLDELFEIQMLLAKEMPNKNTRVGKALDIIDSLIDEFKAEE